jgi:hypothetical protein
MGHALAAIHQANRRRLPMELGFARHHESATLLVGSPPELAAAAAGRLLSDYPATAISRLGDAVVGPRGVAHKSQ